MADKKATDKLSETAGKGEAVVGSAVEYAAYVNYGTRYQSSQPFLTTAGEIIARKLTGIVTEEAQKQMYKSLKKNFNKQIKNNVEMITYGDPLEGVELGNDNALLKAVVATASQAKALSPVKEGELRNSIMWRTEKSEGGFNES